MIAIAAGVMIFIAVLIQAAPFVSEIKGLVDDAGIDTSYGIILIKTVGVCALCQFTSDCCRDNGQNSLASRVELAAKLTIVVISFPMFQKILATAAELLA